MVWCVFDDGCWLGLVFFVCKKVLLKWVELIEVYVVELVVFGVCNNGIEIFMVFKVELMLVVGMICYFVEGIDKIYGEIVLMVLGIFGLIYKELVGVVGVIVFWNFLLMIGVWKLGFVFVLGCSIVLKFVEMVLLMLIWIVELVFEVGLFVGVLNVVMGEGVVVGVVIVESMDVDVLVFIGLGGIGWWLLEVLVCLNFKCVYLELGGKLFNVVFVDVLDFDEVVKVLV